ncbi:DNA-binding transcriptional regulator, HxlR family [Pedococcus dokdonensis]|uniref:DNA-binding transcriptional regulator, HxlR family n=1 Tax=Pedococcus dokdonensis TaxID=443156 RepID=A0A1H0LDB6_9MICO|nr:helix-turn-helix domain-containing protein [Pedococcus dokdonensis]SDO66207.1 DNA-binding transcriptional regulator, HxlR family [Pedococcus dokdonensis]
MSERGGDYCPISMAVDVLGDRWTPLVIRELMVGATGFNEIHRGIPRVSRTLLSQRLRQLERLGLVEREVSGRGRAGAYLLTESGLALTPVVWAMGHWAAEWVFGDPSEADCDGLSLIWRLHQHAIPTKLPPQRTIVHVVTTGHGAAEGWLELSRSGATVCKDDQGHDVDLAVEADTAQLHRWLLGRTSFPDLVRRGDARVLGPSRLGRAFHTWFDMSYFVEDFRRAERRQRELVTAVQAG